MGVFDQTKENIKSELVDFFSRPEEQQKFSDLLSAYVSGKINVMTLNLDEIESTLAKDIVENASKGALEGITAFFEDCIINHHSNVPIDDGYIQIKSEKIPFTHLHAIGSEHIGKIVRVHGLVNRTSIIHPMYKEAVFKCSECGEDSAPIPQENPLTLSKPYGKCRVNGCVNPIWEPIPELSIMVDSQEFMLQESYEDISSNRVPRPITCITFKRSLLNYTNCGDDVELLCAVKAMTAIKKHSKSKFNVTYLEVLQIVKKRKDPALIEFTPEEVEQIHALAQDPQIYRKMIDTLAPSLYGHDDEKEAILLAIFGSPEDVREDLTIRGNIHILMVGDPATAKSQLLRAAVELSPRGMYAMGRGTTAAGLTAALHKTDNTDEWEISAGVLVLADEGIAAIDEIDKMRDEDRVNIHEAMEQQCYDDQTEVLTENGWKLFKDLSKGEKVATLENGVLKYVVPSMFIESEYKGKVVVIKSRQVDLVVTPNHNMFVNVNKRANEWFGYDFVKASDLPLKRMRFKKNAKWNGTDSEFFNLSDSFKIPMNVWLEFLGYYLSEGSIGRTNGIPYRTILTQKPQSGVFTKMVSCIKKMGFKVSITKSNITICSKTLAQHMSKFGLAHEKFISEGIKQLPSEKLRIFYNALIDGDGYIAKSNSHEGYVTSSNQLADDFQELCLKLGFSANKYLVVHQGEKICLPDGRSGIASHNIYELSVIRKRQCEPSINTNGKIHISAKMYSGKIYCVEVPSHLLYVRRNGKPLWCGNTVSIDKAGVHAQLRARTALIAAANPMMGRYDQNKSVFENLPKFPPSLFSRFDLIFRVLDIPNEEYDTRVVTHIIENSSGKSPIDRKLLRKYIAYSKKIKPVLASDAADSLKTYFIAVRKTYKSDQKTFPFSYRQFEALKRLTLARARSLLKEKADKNDVEVVKRLFNVFLRDIGGDVTSVECGKDVSQREIGRAHV